MADPFPLANPLHVLLIGIDCYLPNRLPDGGYYPSLGGCVRDINSVEAFLKGRLGLTDDRLIKLTATKSGREAPPEPMEFWPTYNNMVAAFQRITEAGQPGDQVYIHYSGHGGRSATVFPTLKGELGLDESLVPTDIGNSETRYLRDVEIAHLLALMTSKGLSVTVVLDSCHSGGATRGIGDGMVRGIPNIDTTVRPKHSLVASAEELEKTWHMIASERTRSASLTSGWLPEMKGTVLLAACRANELANEFAFEGRERDGALTYWMLDSLKQAGPGFTFDMLHDRVLAKVHARFQQQTPQLQGDGSRVLFGLNHVPRPSAVRVIEVDLPNRRVKLDAGKVQGLGDGAHFAIYPADVADYGDESSRLGLAEVKVMDGTTAWADLTGGQNLEKITESTRAVLLDAGSVRFRGRVAVVRQEGLPQEIDQAEALRRVAEAVQSSKWIVLAADREGADYQVALNLDREYEVWDQSGQLISNLRPALKMTDPDAATRLIQRLTHMTKYTNVKMIDNSASTARLARGLKVEVLEKVTDNPGGGVILDDGGAITVRITNTSPQALNVTVLDLQPDWGIKKLYPDAADYDTIDPNAEPIELKVKFDLPVGYKEGLDTLKVFATIQGTSFHWLELEPLDQPLTSRVTRSPGNTLEALMMDFAADSPPEGKTRASLVSTSSVQWIAQQVEVLVRRTPRALSHVRDVSTSLLQSAFEEVAAERIVEKAAAMDGRAAIRPSLVDPFVGEIADFLASSEPLSQSPDIERGALDTVRYCARLAAGVAREFWNAHARGDAGKYNEYKMGLTEKFSDCDPNFKEAMTKYAEFLLKSGEVPYRRWQKLSDSVIDSKLPDDATIGLVADWGTGQPEAVEVLRQVKSHVPQVVVHLGDIYYAGTANEVEKYFYEPWQRTLQPETSEILSLTLAGNHDYYSGGQAFYDLIDKFKQPASYFCLRNKDWQLVGLDTGLNDRLGGPPTSLDPSEAEWLRDKIDNAGGRRTVLLSHHQLFSTNEQFDGKSYNATLYAQIKSLLPKIDLWLWGHEHDLVVFGDHLGLKRGRCIGGSAFPVGKYEMPVLPKNSDVPFDKNVILSKGTAFYQHCYVIIKLDGPRAVVNYYEDDNSGRLLFSESLPAFK